MSYLGKQVRINRLFKNKSGRIFSVALDHAIGYGILPGIENIQNKIDIMVNTGVDMVTLLRGSVLHAMPKHAGKIPFSLKLTTLSPIHPTYDTRLTNVIDAVRLGAEAVSIGATLCGENQAKILTQLADFVLEAESYGMPSIAHIYPEGNLIAEKERYSTEWVSYAARTAAEIGIDIVKTHYTGDPTSFAKVIKACPVKVVIAGGQVVSSVRDLFVMTKDAISAGAAGVTYGRNIWQADNPIKLIKAIAHIVHNEGLVDEAIEIFNS